MNDLPPARRFIATVGPPYPDESLLGYVARAASITAVPNLPAVLRIANAVKPNVRSLATTLNDEAEISRLAHLLGCTPYDIASRTYRMSKLEGCRGLQVVDFFGTLIRYRYRETKVRRVSPRALHHAQYHRAAWELRPLSFDSETRELLLDTCPVCKCPLGWIQALGPNFCDNCTDEDGLPTVDLRDFPQPIAQVSDEKALDFVTGLVDPDPEKKAAARRELPDEFCELPNGALFDAIVSMAYGMGDFRSDGPPRVNIEYLRQLTPDMLSVAARGILDGQAGFDVLCERYRSKIGRQPGDYGRLNELGRLVELSQSESALHPQLEPILQVRIGNNIRSQIDAELGLFHETDGTSMPLSHMTSQLKLRPERLRRLSHSGFVPVVRAKKGKLPVRMALRDVAPLVADLDDALRPSDAGVMLRIPAYAVRDLAAYNLIKRLEDPVAVMLGTQIAYSKRSVENLMQRVRAKASARCSGERVTMACTRLRTGTTPWAAVVAAVLEGHAPVAFSRKARELTLSQLMVTDTDAFVAGVRRHLTTEEAPDEEWVGPAEAAEILKITYAALWRLVRARPDILKKQRKGGAPYRVADVRELSSKYIFVGEIALRRQLHPRLAVAWLNSIDIKPAFAIRRKQDLAYLRGEVEPSLERWSTKAA